MNAQDPYRFCSCKLSMISRVVTCEGADEDDE